MPRETELSHSLPREWLLTPSFGKQVLGIIEEFGGLNTSKIAEALARTSNNGGSTSFPPEFDPHSLKDVKEILLNLEGHRLLMHLTDASVGDFWALSTRGAKFLGQGNESYVEAFEKETEQEREGVLSRERERQRVIEDDYQEQLRDQEEEKRLRAEEKGAAKVQSQKIKEKEREEKRIEREKEKEDRKKAKETAKAKRQEEREKKQRKLEREKNKRKREKEKEKRKLEREKNKRKREREKIRKQKRKEKREVRKARKIARKAREEERARIKKLKEDERLKRKKERGERKLEREKREKSEIKREEDKNQKGNDLVQLPDGFGSRVKAWRKYRGLRQKDILAHKDNSYMSDIETDKVNTLKRETALKIAEKLGINLEGLLSEDTEIPEVPVGAPMQPTPAQVEEIAQVAALQREVTSAHPLPKSGIIFVGVRDSGVRVHENGFVQETDPKKLVELGAPQRYGRGDIFFYADGSGEYTLLQDRRVRIRYRNETETVSWNVALRRIGEKNFVLGLQNAIYGKPKSV